MKKLIDGTLVPSRVWYYLLDFNDNNDGATMLQLLYEKQSLRELNKKQFWNFFYVATQRDIENNNK